jgi:hypothetical protein
MSLRNEYLREKAYIVGSSVGESYNPGHISRKNRKDISNVNLVNRDRRNDNGIITPRYMRSI